MLFRGSLLFFSPGHDQLVSESEIRTPPIEQIMNIATRVKKFVGFALLSLSSICNAQAQSTQMSTYCNPINIDYTYAIYNAHRDISYRSGADPAVVRFRNEYYMFVTRSMGYWHSTDLT